MVRWFGDPDLEANLEGDDYFSRQDLDVAFRENQLAENQKNIDLINSNPGQKVVICSTSPRNVVKRLQDANHALYWFCPLVDSGSLTDQLKAITGLPALNTGGTVGTAAWVLSQYLGCQNVAVVGMDLGYYMDTPRAQTQNYHSLKARVENIEDYYITMTYPTGEQFYTDPTYYWYRSNILDLLDGRQLYNCTGGGTLFGPGIINCEIEQWLASC